MECCLRYLEAVKLSATGALQVHNCGLLLAGCVHAVGLLYVLSSNAKHVVHLIYVAASNPHSDAE